jgi:hypothetical protein
MIQRKLQRPKKEPKVGLTLRLDKTEFGFLQEVKTKRGCTMAAYIRFLIHRSTYESLKSESRRHEKAMETVSLLLKARKLTKNFRLLITESEHQELERVKLKTGISFNTYVRWILRRRMVEYSKLEGELFEIV